MNLEKIQTIPPDLTDNVKYEKNDGAEGGHGNVYKGVWTTPEGTVILVHFLLRGHCCCCILIRCPL